MEDAKSRSSLEQRGLDAAVLSRAQSGQQRRHALVLLSQIMVFSMAHHRFYS